MQTGPRRYAHNTDDTGIIMNVNGAAFMDIQQSIIISIALIGMATLASQWIAWSVKLPAILFLLLFGILLGHGFGWGLINPQQLFGPLLFPVISIAVAIILFEGSLYLRFRQVAGLAHVITRLVSIGYLCTVLCSLVLAHYLFHMHWKIALLFATLASVGGPTVIAPMLRTIRPRKTLHHILHWESILIDPIGALIALLSYSAVISTLGKGTTWGIGAHFLEVISLGLVLGLAAAYTLGHAIRHQWLPEYLYNVSTLIMVILTFIIANQFSDGAGLLAVTIMGIYLTNVTDIHIQSIVNFKESLSILLISGLFIILAARVPFTHMKAYLVSSLLFYLVAQFLIRPLSVLLSTWGSNLSWREKTLLAWLCPRGIVAAAIAAVFTLKLTKLGYDQADPFVLLTFLLIVYTVLIQSATARPLARWLGVAAPDATGFLLIGANPVARAIATALGQAHINTLLIDTHWDNISQARMDGLNAYYGYALSEETQQDMNLCGIGGLLALTAHHEFNQLACLHYQTAFGRRGVFLLATSAQTQRPVHAKKTDYLPLLFEPHASYSMLAAQLRQGASIKITALSEQFDFQQYLEQEKKSTLLFYIDNKGNPHPFTVNSPRQMQAGWKIIALAPAKQAENGVHAEVADAR